MLAESRLTAAASPSMVRRSMSEPATARCTVLTSPPGRTRSPRSPSTSKIPAEVWSCQIWFTYSHTRFRDLLRKALHCRRAFGLDALASRSVLNSNVIHGSRSGIVKLFTTAREVLRYTALATPKFFRGPIFVMAANAVETVLASSTADFKSLEEKVLRTIELLKSAREAKAAAERDAARLREQLNQREEEADTLRQEVVALRREREEVRTRVEKMLDQIEALTAEESA